MTGPAGDGARPDYRLAGVAGRRRAAGWPARLRGCARGWMAARAAEQPACGWMAGWSVWLGDGARLDDRPAWSGDGARLNDRPARLG